MTPIMNNAGQIPEDAGPVERWWLIVRSSTLKQVVLESALSMPIPQWVDGNLVLAAFYFGTKTGGGPGKGKAEAPIARLIASYPEGHLIEFIKGEPEQLFAGVNIPLELGPLTTGNLSVAERNAFRHEFYRLYPAVLEAYQLKQSFDERAMFSHLFYSLIVPGLVPVYESLNPDFFVWMKGG